MKKKVVKTEKISGGDKVAEVKKDSQIASLIGRNEKIGDIVRIPSGIEGFDKLVEGGLLSESINLVAGGAGTGKTIFALQFLMEGVQRGEVGLYITFEEKRNEFYKNMKSFGFDLEKAEKSGKFIFLEYSPEKVKRMLEEGGGSIESMVLSKKVKRLVVDSLSSFFLLFDDKLEMKQSNSALFEIVRKWNTTAFFTVQQNLSSKGKDIFSIGFETDSIIQLYFKRVKGVRKRFIEILKMRGTKHSTKVNEFVLDNKGMRIGRSRR